LDFLEADPHLVKWYGASYPFRGNPYSFAFPMSSLWPHVATDKQVESYLKRMHNDSRRSCRQMISSRPAGVSFNEPEDVQDAAQARKDDRIHRDAVIATQMKLEELSNDM
jgi:hypothetical protein